MAQAVGEQDDFGRVAEGPPDLSDVVAIAILMASHASDAAALNEALNGLGAAAEVNALSQALGD